MNFLGGQLMHLWLYGALAQRVLTKIPVFQPIRERIYLSWWTSVAKEMGVEITDLGQGYCRITKGDRATVIQGHCVNVDTYLNLMLVDNKPFVHKMLEDSGYRVPRYKAFEFTDPLGGVALLSPAVDQAGLA